MGAAPVRAVYASELGLSMLGSIISQKKNNVVLIKVRESGKVIACRAGSVIDKMYLVKEILADYTLLHKIGPSQAVVLKVYKDGFTGRSGSYATVQAQARPAAVISDSYREEGFEREGGEIQLTGAYRQTKILGELPKILMQASAEPVVRSGRIRGFLLDQIERGSIFEKSGLQDGDMVKSINGIPLNDVTATIKMLHALKNAREIEFVLERGGQDIPVRIHIK